MDLSKIQRETDCETLHIFYKKSEKLFKRIQEMVKPQDKRISYEGSDK